MNPRQRYLIRDDRPCTDRVLGVLIGLGMSGFLTAAPAHGLQVPLLGQDSAEGVERASSAPVSWRPSETLAVGETMVLLGEKVALLVDPSATLQTGTMVPGGIQAPFRLGTALAVSVRAKPGLRSAPLLVRGPAEAAGGTKDLGLLGPGAEFILWREGDPAQGWCYVRVLEVSSDSARMEVATCAGDVEELRRDPVGLVAERGTEISWASFSMAGEGDTGLAAPRYSVERRGVGASAWSMLAENVAADADGLCRLEDPTGRDEPATVFEYKVTRVGASPGPLKFGRMGDMVRAHGFSEEAAKVDPGSLVNLVSGLDVGGGEDAHIELIRAAPGSVMLEPQGGVRLGSALKAEHRDQSSWRLPDASDPSWLPVKAVRVRDGEEVPFLLPNGLAGRMSIQELGSERWILRRELSYDGSGLLPRPPVAPLKTLVEAASDPSASSGRLILSLAPPQLGSGVDPRDVAFQLEHQPRVGTGEWEVLAATGPGTTTFDIDDAFRANGAERRAIVRLRLRYQIPFGPSSSPGEHFDVLSAGSSSELRLADLDDALEDLGSEDFRDRMEASAFLVAMGDDARPALEALAQISGGSPAGLAALDLLRALDERGGAGVRLGSELRALALESLRGRRLTTGGVEAEPNGEEDRDPIDQWLGDIPPGLTADTARARAHGLLKAIDLASRGGARSGPRGTVAEDCERALAWAQAVATADPDEGVRWMARIASEVGLRPSLASFEPEGPAWLLPPNRRSSPERLDFGWGDQPGTAEELRWQLEARPELASLQFGPALARLHAALAPAEQLTRIYGAEAARDAEREAAMGDSLGIREPRLFDYDSSAAELVLRLVERARAPGADSVLLAAAESLLPGAHLTLEAWRSVSDRRLATPSADAVVRERIELEGNRLGDLSALLSELTGDAGVDIVLGAGSWTDGAEDPKGSGKSRLGSTSLVIRCNDVRLIAKGDGPVWLHAGLRVYGKNVVLQDLIVDHAQGGALTVLDGGHVVTLGCKLRGMGTVIHLQDGTAEVIECELGGADPASPPATAVRLILESRLYARASLFDAGSIFVSSGAEVWLDRCVLDARSRMLVQAQDKGRLFVRESLLRGEGSGLFRVSDGLLVGSVIDVPRDPLGRLPQSLQDGGIRVSPRFFHLVQEGQDVPPAMQLDSEPLAVPGVGSGNRR